MKYVRTKDEIVDISNYIEEELYYQDTKSPDYIGKEKIIKQADTIEELCDEFRVRDNDNYSTYEIDITCHNLKELYEEMQIQNETLFGAIWTEFGLKYVAQLNSNGELELL